MDENLRSDGEIGKIQKSSENQRSYEDWGNEEAPRCIVSDPAHPHKVSRVAGSETKQDCSSCGKRSTSWYVRDNENLHYYCTICKVEFHHECLGIPSKMIHPYHPQHPLTFSFLKNETGMIVDTNFGEFFNVRENGVEEFKKTFVPVSNSSIIFDKCTWCGKFLRTWLYRCQICNFTLDLNCATKKPPHTIQNPKSHHHSISLFPRPLSFPCNACGLINVMEPGYACYQCYYFVHESCIDLPRVMKITRHPHRLYHTPNLPPKVSSCRICYRNVDIKYGQYSCNHEDCSYVVHSKCATDKNVWDGEELEWVPEESEEIVAPYKKAGHGLIEHFCHDHHYLKLEKYNSTRDSGKQCQACMRSITSHDFYNCVECDYFLHEVCANLPRQLDHALHNHTLSMDPYPRHCDDYHALSCFICSRESSGWKYICKKGRGPCTKFQVDVNCVLVPECFTHESHPEHLLFISSTYDHYDRKFRCQGCKKECFRNCLRCTICEFAICFKCSTIPYELYYKYDEHPLSLCHGESGVDDMYWCEVCETRLDPREWFYTNKEGCTTIHLTCLFGDIAYMKSGHTISCQDVYKVVVVSNGSSRPICHTNIFHQHRCTHPLYLKVYILGGTVIAFCSFHCLIMYMQRILFS
ncbi:hypothetical protein AALP_AA5G244900 [Arabis alpina]|uniref:Phorbol-ester/DAG-type domain-containing protein n=1 Tax=Arabis alpina TaxID=50452 RepID=A0A087GZ48_ARAAL|nr:hypothetical protein AALP_AA5G244900 [Arabis alpina]